MGDAKEMLIDVLNYWLETDQWKSWSQLAEAVDDTGHRVLAEKIRQVNFSLRRFSQHILIK